MSISRPRLLVIKGPSVPGEELARLLAQTYEVMVTDSAAAMALSPKGVLGAASQGYQVVLCDTALLNATSITTQPAIGGSGPIGGMHGLSLTEMSAALSSIGEGVCICSMDGQLAWANDRFRAFDDQTRARITAVCRRAAVQFEEQLLEQEAAGFSATSQKFEIASPDEQRFYEVVVSPVRSLHDPVATLGAGPLERVCAVVWDVSHSKRVQQKMEAIDRAGTELVRLDVENIRKLHVLQRQKLLEDKIVRFSHELLHFDHLVVRRIDEQTGKLELIMSRGLPPEATDIELFAKRDGNGIMGYVASSGTSYLCPDVSKDRRYIQGMTGARSSLTVPLRLNDKVIGAFNVESEKLANFTEEDRHFAQIFANHIALAMHILDLLVVERQATGKTVTGAVQGEIQEPLQDIRKQVELLKQRADKDPTLRDHIERILTDVGAIQNRIEDAASGPQHILGADKAEAGIDPLYAGRHVLVADDEAKIRLTIRDVLRGKGCKVTVCPNGGAAIAELESAGCGVADKFDLVISDIKMPDKNGYEVFSAAKRIDPSLPVILMTGFGYDPSHSIVRASQEGLQCVLFKPFQLERLLDEVRKSWAGAGPSETPAAT